jgi:6-pyruvoyltetrahydropterin/6-carboxytetrahydropterin synthase
LLYLTRKAEFAASHYYHNPELSPEENSHLFGKCSNPNGHGHNYVLEVTVKGEVDPRSGFVVDLKQLKETMNREVLDAMDHRFLNKEVPEFATRIPTTENLAIAIWQRLAPKLTNAKLHRVRVYENHDLFVDFYGESS